MTSELLASVCQSGKSSLANASLLASRFGKNRHCWKNAFPHCCVWIRSSLDKVFPATELRPFFSNTFSMPLYQLLVLVFCKQFCARSREMDIWKHKTVLADPNLSETIQRGILHLEHLQRQYQGVRQIFRSEIVNCNSLQIDWITRWQLHLQAKSTNWEKNKSKVSI